MVLLYWLLGLAVFALFILMTLAIDVTGSGRGS